VGWRCWWAAPPHRPKRGAVCRRSGLLSTMFLPSCCFCRSQVRGDGGPSDSRPGRSRSFHWVGSNSSRMVWTGPDSIVLLRRIVS
jgi:hypothetical protein